MTPASSVGLLLTFLAFTLIATWQASADSNEFRLLYPISLPEVLAGGVPCPSIPAGYQTDHAAIGPDGFHHGDYFFDARVDLSTCDANTRPIARSGRSAVLNWWVNRCENDYAFIGNVVKIKNPGDRLRYVTVTRSAVEKGCGGLEEARQGLDSGG